MKRKMMMHFAIYFIFAALFLIIVNVLYMESAVYSNEVLYYYDPGPLWKDLKKNFQLEPLALKESFQKKLYDKNIGVQIVNDDFIEVLRVNVPDQNIPSRYSLKGIIELYKSETTTIFVHEMNINHQSYTFVLFMDSEYVGRTLYTYDVDLLKKTYNPLWLIGMNIILLLLVSFLYTQRMSKPINRIISNIVNLSKGSYEVQSINNGIYKEVDTTINELSDQLQAIEKEKVLIDKSREEWITNISHDIKTPLTSILGYAEYLKDSKEVLSLDEQRKFMTVIHDKSFYIKELLDDLNLSTRLKYNQWPLELETVNIVDEIKSTLIEFHNTMDNQNEVSFSYDANEIYSSIDRRLFKRVLLNLMNNAVIHNEKGIKIDVSVKLGQKAYHQIIVEDNGKGVNSEEYSKIFSRYYRGTHTNIKKEGSGLGLAITKDIINAHDGKITVEKSDLGGLRMIIYLEQHQIE